MQILDNKYTLQPGLNGVNIIDSTSGKLVFVIPDDFDFDLYKKSDDLYVIGCVTITTDTFNSEFTKLANFRNSTVQEYRDSFNSTHAPTSEYS